MGLTEDVKEAYDDLRGQIPLFPKNCCKFAALLMHAKGYDIVAGNVKLDNYCHSGRNYEMPHYWNYDPLTGLYFDLTSEQFNISIKGEPLPQIAMWKENEANPVYEIRRKKIMPREVI